MNIKPSNRIKSLPPYTFAEIDKKVQALKAAFKRGEAAEPIAFGVGDPSEPTPEFVIDGLTASGKKHATSGYPSYIGSKDFRQAAADYMNRTFTVTFNPETEISSTIGSKEAIFNFPEAIVNPGDIVICPSPGYPPYKTGTIFAEGEVYFTPLLKENNFLIDYNSIPQKICDKAKIIWINYPNSPTGAVATREYYEGLIAWAHKNNIIIAADEGCYIEIYFEEKPLSIFEIGKEGIIGFYSLSKRNNMTGYRSGFVCGDEKLVSIFKSLKTNIDSGTPSVIQEAGIIALRDDEHVAYMRNLYKEKRDLLMSALEGAGLTPEVSAATFYLWQKVPEGMTDVEFAEKLLSPEIAIIVTPGSMISDVCQGVTNPGEGYVRFALMPTIEKIREAGDRIRGMF